MSTRPADRRSAGAAAGLPANAARPPAPLRKLGQMRVADFMRRYWQREPLLIRAAFASAEPLVDWASLAALAARDDVESRLIERSGSRWHLTQGPIRTLPSAKRPNWTLLVQGVDLHLDAVHTLLRRFRFVSDARLDDIMVSIASDGGGVGPHWDSYDVFLLQVQGQRRWRVGPTGYPGQLPATVPGLPLKIIAQPRFDREFVLVPGDMLYLPPGWAHDGIAMGPCTTLSVGFRSPSPQELLRAWLADRADTVADSPGRYSDAGIPPTRTPGAVPEPMAATMHQWIARWRPRRSEIDDFIGRYLTEPKATVWFDPPARKLSEAAFVALARRRGLQFDPKTRVMYRKKQLFINGERAPAPVDPLWRRFVNQRLLCGVILEQALQDPRITSLLHQWWSYGWLACNKSVR